MPRRRSLLRAGIVRVLAAAAVATMAAGAAVGCSSSDGSDADTTGSPGLEPSVSSSTDEPAGSSGPTTSLGAAELTRVCEEYVPLAAFMGDPQMRGLWSGVGQDAAVLATRCAEIAQSDPEYLVGMAADLEALRAQIAASTTAPPAPSAETPLDQPPAPTASDPGAPAVSAVDTSLPAAEPAPPRATGGAVMPDVLCTRLSDAVTALAAVGITDPVTFDATGAGRVLAVDGTWVVVTQSPGADRPIADAGVRLGVVRRGERGSC